MLVSEKNNSIGSDKYDFLESIVLLATIETMYIMLIFFPVIATCSYSEDLFNKVAFLKKPRQAIFLVLTKNSSRRRCGCPILARDNGSPGWLHWPESAGWQTDRCHKIADGGSEKHAPFTIATSYIISHLPCRWVVSRFPPHLDQTIH